MGSKQKVFIVGTDFFGYTYSVQRAFQKLDWDTEVYIYKPEVTDLIEKIEYRITRNKEDFRRNTLPLRFNKKLLKAMKKYGPNLFLMFQETPVSRATVFGLNGCRKVIWLMDSIFRKELIYDIKDLVDKVFLFEETDIPKLLEKDRIQANFLPCALDEEQYFPIVGNKDIDILFVGHIYDNRMTVLKEINDFFNSLSIKFYGVIDSEVMRKYSDYLNDNNDVFLNKNITPRETNLLYSRSKICINIHHSQNSYGVNQRFFEIGGSESFQIVDRNEFIEDNFSDDEVFLFTSVSELLEKIETALKSSRLRNKMAKRFRHKILSEHTFVHRIEKIVSE